jgi:hypothetical protein
MDRRADYAAPSALCSLLYPPRLILAIMTLVLVSCSSPVFISTPAALAKLRHEASIDRIPSPFFDRELR